MSNQLYFFFRAIIGELEWSASGKETAGLSARQAKLSTKQSLAQR